MRYLIVLLTGFALWLGSCNTQPSLQRYFVDNQEKRNFIVVDVPASVVTVKESELTEQQQKALQSFKKLNVLAYKKDSLDVSKYKTEKDYVKSILTQDRYKTLLKIKDNKTNLVVKYIGTDEVIDEVVLFGSDDATGFGVIRVLGNEMNAQQIAQLVEVIRMAKIDDSEFKELTAFFTK